MIKKKIGIVVGVILFAMLMIYFASDSKAIKVDYRMDEPDGTIEFILADLGIEFDDVASGVNCLSGMSEKTFNTEKYGVLHTEFTYCNYTNTVHFRIYNLESEQSLRNPTKSEKLEYDSFGMRK